MAHRLVERGATVAVPSLLGATSTAEQAQAVADAAVGTDAPDVVLVGHGGAGPLLPAMGAAVVQRGVRPAAYLFVDADLPHPGSSRLAMVHPALWARLAPSVVGDTLPPWNEWTGTDVLEALVPDAEARARVRAELRPVPLATLREPMPEVAGWPDAPCGYLRLSGANYAWEAEAAAQGWAVVSLESDHLHMVVDPDRVMAVLVRLLDRLGVSL